MDNLGDALRAGAMGAEPALPHRSSLAPLSPIEPVLVLGAGGRLGSALLAEALVAGRFPAVQAWVAGPLTSTLRGLRPLTDATFASGPLQASVAFIVFERQRFSNGRDDAFVMPLPELLHAYALRLREGGVRRLLVVLPHASAMLPQALAAGLATHDEVAIAALGFEQLVLIKPSLDATAARPVRWLARFAQWWLSQLRWMVPQREQPLRAAVLARLTVMLAGLLPAAARGTYVVPQALLWQLAQDADGGRQRLAEWLGPIDSSTLPATPAMLGSPSIMPP